MKITRKEFFQLAGLSLIAVSAKKLVRGTAKAAASEGTAKTTRWGMAIDLQKCRQKEGCRRCINACHSAHNVPQFADRAHQIKWIWKQPFSDVFPFAQTQYTGDLFASLPVLLM